MKIFLLLLLFIAPLHAHSVKKQGLYIGHATIKPFGQRVIFPIANILEDEVWLRVFDEDKQQLELFRNDSPVALPLKLEAKQPIAMRENGLHLRLKNAKPFKEGDKFKLILEFTKSGKVEVEVWVEANPDKH